MTMPSSYSDYRGFEFCGAFVRTRNIIAFTAQKWDVNDPLEQRDTAVFFYYADEPADERWAFSYFGETTGVHGCACFQPLERWIFVMDDGEVYVVGMGDDDWEEPITKTPHQYFSNVKSIDSGHAIAVGSRRKVFLREEAGEWNKLDAGLFPDEENTTLRDAGFQDLDGFGENDMYACGGRSDLWRFDGARWQKIDVPPNMGLKNVCCASDGFVYITTDSREILRGRGETWERLTQDKTNEVFEGIVEFEEKVIVSTVSSLYRVDGGTFRAANLNEPELTSRAHIAAGDGVLVVAGSDCAAIFDGHSWTKIFDGIP